MIFVETKLAGAYIIEPERQADERGFFARTFCSDAFAERGLATDFPQCNISFNAERGTLRGMHYQEPPHAEAKLVRCTMGAIHDVIVDLRPDSPTFKQWVAVELSAKSRWMLYIPEGFAHGFLTLTDSSEVFYQISERYRAASARGVRYDDPAFGIDWPGPVRVISEKDRNLPRLEDLA